MFMWSDVMAFVEFYDVGKTYHMGEIEINALHDANFEVEQGELVVIVGPSGAGKTIRSCVSVTIGSVKNHRSIAHAARQTTDAMTIPPCNDKRFTCSGTLPGTDTLRKRAAGPGPAAGPTGLPVRSAASGT